MSSASDLESPAGSPRRKRDSELSDGDQGANDRDNVDTKNMGDDLSDDDSDLSDVDEAQFLDFDPKNIAIEDRPAIAVDDSNVNLLGVHKRKRAPGEESAKTKKKKEGKREKKSKVPKDSDDDFSGGEELEGKRIRKKKAITSSRKDRPAAVVAPRPRAASPENEEELSPEERRRRALDKAMDAALRNPNQRRRKKDGEDLQALADEEIERLRNDMILAAEADVTARIANKPAMHKLKLLPAVMSLLSRSNLRDSFVDPDTNFLEAVRFFLEPLNDGSLPAYNIQRDLFAALETLPIDKDALIASGIGKVTLFYTKSKKPEVGIKRIAERLIADWSRPILARPDDYRQKAYEMKDFDPTALPLRTAPSASQLTPAQRREKELAMPIKNPNRARVEEGPKSYSIVPKSVVSGQPGSYSRPLGASGDDAFRRMKARQAATRR